MNKNELTDYIAEDLNKYYGLDKEVSVTIRGENINELFGKQERMIECKHTYAEPSGKLKTIVAMTIWNDVSGNKVVLTAKPFPIESRLWNGANVIPDTDYESMLASLFHDIFYELMESLALKLDKTPSEVRKWADDALYAIWSGTARSPLERLKARIGFGICRAFGGIFHRVTKWFIFIVALLAIGGCCVPDWTLEDVEGGETIEETINNGN